MPYLLISLKREGKKEEQLGTLRRDGTDMYYWRVEGQYSWDEREHVRRKEKL
jgi:hypothetical protein